MCEVQFNCNTSAIISCRTNTVILIRVSSVDGWLQVSMETFLVFAAAQEDHIHAEHIPEEQCITA